ncbi:MAG TPA: GNAT family N-acetyltransferase [Parvularculaceae bacterium]|nr:GNAT family N-acetyltransferase [Parvularculaceae bacterium]
MRAAIDIISDRAAFRDEWRRLYARSDASFFLSPPWIETLIDSRTDRTTFKALRIFDDLHGVYGAALIGEARTPIMPGAVARLHETGDEAIDRVYLEYNDILIAHDAAPQARLEAICAVIESAPKVDEFVFRNARPPLAAAVIAAGERLGLKRRTLLRQPTFFIDLTSGVMEGFSASLRAKIRRAVRRYEERGAVRLIISKGEAERDVAWTELMRLHAKTWGSRGQRGVFSAPEFLNFHRRLIERFPSNADLVRILAGDDTIGVLYNFIDRDRAYNYQSGFLYEASNQLAPGFVAHALAAEHYREKGLKAYDMMGGDADYKRRLGSEGETLETLVLERPSLKSKLRNLIRRKSRAHGAGKRQT